jgi:hypothetical protein
MESITFYVRTFSTIAESFVARQTVETVLGIQIRSCKPGENEMKNLLGRSDGANWHSLFPWHT